jgi:hypothetical protein
MSDVPLALDIRFVRGNACYSLPELNTPDSRLISALCAHRVMVGEPI